MTGLSKTKTWRARLWPLPVFLFSFFPVGLCGMPQKSGVFSFFAAKRLR